MKLERFILGLSAVFILGVFLFFANTPQGNPDQANAHASEITDGPSALLHDKKLVFSDEFNGDALDTAKWATCYDWRKPSETGCTNHGNFEQQWYTDNQVKIQDGQLILIADKGAVEVVVQNQIKLFKYTSGMINSGRGDTGGSVRWAGTYGYYEAKMKVQEGQGVWPAFWLLPIDKEWPPEIDIMEFIGSKPNEILQTLHWPAGDKPQKSDTVTKSENSYTEDWHTYAIDWRPDRIDWYIDGVKTKTYSGPNVPSKPMEIIINLAIGGLLPGNADETTPLQREVRVDHVRVYQSEDQIRPYQY